MIWIPRVITLLLMLPFITIGFMAFVVRAGLVGGYWIGTEILTDH